MSRVALLWHLLLPVICVVSPLNGRASCDEQWREGLKLSRARSGNGNHVTEEEYQNTSTIPPAVLHAALRDHWLDHYKTKLLRDLNMQSAPEPGSRRLPKSIRRQLEMIKAREGEPLAEQFDECPTSTASTKNEHVRDVVAQGPKSTANRLRPPSWIMVDSRAKPVKRVVSSTPNTPEGRFVEDAKRSYFSLTAVRDSDIANATLFIHVQRPPSPGDGDAVMDELQVYVYKYLNQTHVVAEPVVVRKFKHNFALGAWLSIDLTALVHQWVRSPSRNYGIMIKAELSGRDVINRTVDEHNRTSTIILAMDVDESASATRLPPTPAEEATCSAEDSDVKCCRYPLEINFESFGWDWVIAPKRYNAYYCAGTCPVNYKQMSTHAHLMQQLDFLSSSTTSHRRSLGPCCTPQDYQDVKVIYIAQDRSIKETLIPGAIVLRCGCA